MIKALTTFVIFLLLTNLTGCAGVICEYAGNVYSPPNLTAETSAVAHDLPPIRRVDLRNGQPYRPFATYGQCQIELSYVIDLVSGLPIISDIYRSKVESCVSLAIKENVNILILPELSLGFRETTRSSLIEKLKAVSQERNMIIIAGSFYDRNRQSRIPVIGPGWEESGYKLKPSRFEASPKYGFGMKEGKELLVLDTIFGRIIPLVCVDLISDSAQYTIRNLSTRGQVDVIANLNFNPAAWEFLIEGNSISRRHPVIVSITNVSSPPDSKTRTDCQQKGDNGFCFGNSALFASLREGNNDCTNCARVVADLVEPVFKTGDVRSLPYDTLVAVIPPFQEEMLIYDVNLRLLREPVATNAPDQGYPVVRNVRRVPLFGQ